MVRTGSRGIVTAAAGVPGRIPPDDTTGEAAPERTGFVRW